MIVQGILLHPIREQNHLRNSAAREENTKVKIRHFRSPPMSPNDSPGDTELVRPSSVWTNDSTFADSAIMMDGTSTPKQTFEDDRPEMRSPSPSPIPSPSKPSLSERLTQLAAIAWVAEQDGFVDAAAQNKILRSLATVETCLEQRDEDLDHGGTDREPAKETPPDDQTVDIAELEPIHQALSATVSEMRLRQQEQRHIHELTIRKLESVASTCASQRRHIEDIQAEIQVVRIENKKLQRDQKGFNAHAEQLTAELQQKDIALQAMSSAVAGLDGWISNTLGPEHGLTQRVRASRGRGRFQTHYYVDVPAERASQDAGGSAVDARELREGLSAWVRGFRDVEDATAAGFMSHSHSGHNGSSQMVPQSMSSFAADDSDWGDFQTASTAPIGGRR